ncbi:MAG: hypothetical protein AAGA60_07575 [Cyanobacteria bacterium P01_E01_bin.42]
MQKFTNSATPSIPKRPISLEITIGSSDRRDLLGQVQTHVAGGIRTSGERAIAQIEGFLLDDEGMESKQSIAEKNGELRYTPFLKHLWLLQCPQ